MREILYERPVKIENKSIDSEIVKNRVDFLINTTPLFAYFPTDTDEELFAKAFIRNEITGHLHTNNYEHCSMSHGCYNLFNEYVYVMIKKSSFMNYKCEYPLKLSYTSDEYDFISFTNKNGDKLIMRYKKGSTMGLIYFKKVIEVNFEDELKQHINIKHRLGPRTEVLSINKGLEKINKIKHGFEGFIGTL